MEHSYLDEILDGSAVISSMEDVVEVLMVVCC